MVHTKKPNVSKYSTVPQGEQDPTSQGAINSTSSLQLLQEPNHADEGIDHYVTIEVTGQEVLPQFLSSEVEGTQESIIFEAERPVSHDVTDTDIVDKDEREREARAIRVGAGVASGIFCCLLTGPVLALIFGLGAAYACDNDHGALGDSARALGHVAIQAQQQAQQINQRHHVVEKTQQAASTALESLRDMEREHRIAKRTKQGVVSSCQTCNAWMKRHRVGERSVRTVGKCCYRISYWLVDRVDRMATGSNSSMESGITKNESMNRA